MGNEAILFIGTIFQFLAVIIYFVGVFPIQVKEVRVKDSLMWARWGLLVGCFAFVGVSIVFLIAALIRYFNPPLPSWVVYFVFSFNGIGNLIAVIMFYTLYRLKYIEK